MGHGLTPAEVSNAQAGFNSVSQVFEAFARAKQAQQQQDIANKQNADRIKIEQQHADQEEASRKDLSAKAAKQLDLEQQRFDAEHELQSIQKQQLTQQLLHQYELSGIPISGDDIITKMPDLTGMEQHFSPSLGINATIPSPQTYANQQADIARISQQPAEEATARRYKEQSEDQQAKALAVAAQQHADRLAELAQNNEYENDRQASSLRAQKTLRDSENALGLRKAMIEATGGLSEDPSFKTGVTIQTGPDGQPVQKQTPIGDFVTNTIRQLRDGQMSTDQLKKQFPKQAPTILRLANEQGIGGLTDAQKARIDDLNSVAQIVPALRKMNQINEQYPNEVFIPGTDANKAFNGLKQQVEGALPTISRALSGVKRFNGFEMDQYKNYLEPTRGVDLGGPLNFQPTAANSSKYNDFVTHDIQDAFNTATSNLPQGQRDIIKQRIGLNNLPSLSNALSAPGVNSGTPTGMTPALPSSPNAIHWIMQNGKLVQVGQQ